VTEREKKEYACGGITKQRDCQDEELYTGENAWHYLRVNHSVMSTDDCLTFVAFAKIKLLLEIAHSKENFMFLLSIELPVIEES
jgi:hypothetical protein